MTLFRHQNYKKPYLINHCSKKGQFMKLEIYNSIVNQKITLSLQRMADNSKTINVIYASNGVGKSSLANIIENVFINEGNDIVNKFNGVASLVKITENLENITSVYKYDRTYVLKSSDIYKKKLIVAPKSAQNFVDISQKIDSVKSEFAKYYPKLSDITSVLNKKKDILKKTKLSLFTTKTITEDKAENIFKELADISKDRLKDTKLAIIDLIEMKEYLSIGFVQEIKKISKIADETIKDFFPEISIADYELYGAIYSYLDGNQSFVGKKCLMCGETEFNAEKLQKRCAEIKNLIEKYHAKSSQLFFDRCREFVEKEYDSTILNEMKAYLKSINSKNILKISSQVSNIISDIDIGLVINDYENHILNLVAEQVSSFKYVENYCFNINEMEKIKKTNKTQINEPLKDKFLENLKFLGFKYSNKMEVKINFDGFLEISCHGIDSIQLYEVILSESEKTILSLALFLAIVETSKALIIIDDPIDSHDQKNKCFIINQIFDFVKSNDVLTLVLTHDISFSQACSYIDKSVKIGNMLLTKTGIEIVNTPSIYFKPPYDYIGEIFEHCKHLNKTFIIPISMLLRYLSKNQFKFFKEVNVKLIKPGKNTTAKVLIKRAEIRNVGFKDFSNQIMHFNKSINADGLINTIDQYLKMNFSGSVFKPLQRRRSTVGILHYLLSFLKDVSNYTSSVLPQFAREFIVMTNGILLRTSLEKRLLCKKIRGPKQEIGDIAEIFAKSHSKNHPLYEFYLRNKSILNDFCHLESGIEVMFNYDEDELIRLQKELKKIKL